MLAVFVITRAVVVLAARLIVVALLVVVARLIVITLLVILLITVARLIVVALLVLALVVVAAGIVLARLRAAHLGQIDEAVLFFIDRTKAASVGLLGITRVTAFGTVIATLVAIVLPITVAILAAVLVVLVILGVLIILTALKLLAAFLLGCHLARGFGQHAGVMLGVLAEVFSGHTVVGPLGVTRQHLIFLDDLLRRTAHFAFGARAVEDAVDDIAEGARAIRL